jgi:S1-C subfamily serine protease
VQIVGVRATFFQRLLQTGSFAMLCLRLIVAVSLLTASAAAAEDTDQSLLIYAVSINRSASSRWGTGIYLGKGLVLTASHVVGRNPFKKPNVTIAGQDLPAKVLKQGMFERSDLALLEIDEASLPTRIRLRRISLCEAPPWPGEDIVTVIPEEAVHSHVMSPKELPLQVRRFSTIISDVARTGNSGSGVFDSKKKCLLGIMSRKITQVRAVIGSSDKQTYDVAKYFVPASAIAEFLPAGVDLGPKQ